MPIQEARRFGEPRPGGLIFCVVTRIFDAELPYVGSFIRHYAGLGVQRMFFVNTFRAHYSEVCEYVGQHVVEGTELVVTNTRSDDGEVNKMQNEALSPSMGDFVINVDVDEYWVLPPSIPDLSTLVRVRPADVYQFYWLMVPFDRVTAVPRAPYRGFHGTNGKYMARPSNLRRLGVHRPSLKGGGRRAATFSTCGSLVHFWGRGFKDCLLKCVGQKIGNSKTSSKEELLRLASEGDVPNRLKLLAYFCLQPRGARLRGDPRHTLLKVDRAKEDELLQKKVSGAEFETVRALYLRFVRRLRSESVWASLPDYSSGISDLTAVEALEPIRAPVPRARRRPLELRSGGEACSLPAAKSRRMAGDSEDSTAAGTPSESAAAGTPSESEAASGCQEFVSDASSSRSGCARVA